MGFKNWIYTALKVSNDINAVTRAAEQKSAKPVIRRIGRRAYGKITGRLARKLFG